MATHFYTDEAQGILNSQRFKELEDKDYGVQAWQNITQTELNNHFGDLRSLEARLRAYQSSPDKDQEKAFAYLESYLWLTKSRMLNRLNKQKNPDLEFKEWLINHWEKIESVKDFEAFILIFETAYGLSKEKTNKPIEQNRGRRTR
jgi:hypothetical protein